MFVQQGQGGRGLVDPDEFVCPLQDIFGLLMRRRRLRGSVSTGGSLSAMAEKNEKLRASTWWRMTAGQRQLGAALSNPTTTRPSSIEKRKKKWNGIKLTMMGNLLCARQVSRRMKGGGIEQQREAA